MVAIVADRSRVVEMESLSIAKGQSAWKLMVDVYCVDHDGNVLDAALTSVMAALKTLKLPATSINEADNVVSIVPGEAGQRAVLTGIPRALAGR
jgi:exosome complex RNA-binding protein Rrp42 (RNase PH superfamily)